MSNFEGELIGETDYELTDETSPLIETKPNVVLRPAKYRGPIKELQGKKVIVKKTNNKGVEKLYALIPDEQVDPDLVPRSEGERSIINKKLIVGTGWHEFEESDFDYEITLPDLQELGFRGSNLKTSKTVGRHLLSVKVTSIGIPYKIYLDNVELHIELTFENVQKLIEVLSDS